MISNVSNYQSPSVTYQREPRNTAETQRLQHQEPAKASPEQRREESVQDRRSMALSPLGQNVDFYA